MRRIRKSLPRIVFIAMTAVVASGFVARSETVCAVHMILHADNSIEFDGTRIADDAKLITLLKQYHKQNLKCSMSIAAEPGAKFVMVARALAAMQRAGIGMVGFLFEPRNESN